MANVIAGQAPDLLQGIRFVVKIDGLSYGFTECEGLGSGEVDIVDYREGIDPTLTMQHVPGLIKYDNITLKRGMAQDHALERWWEQIQAAHGVELPALYRGMTIDVMSRSGAVRKTYSVVKALVKKYKADNLVAGDSKVLIEEIEFVHQGSWRSPAGVFKATPPSAITASSLLG